MKKNVGPANWYYAVNPNRYTNNELKLLWLEKVFEIEKASLANSQRYVLISKRHGSHRIAKFLTFCFAYNIFLLRLLVNTSHLTQPLDVSCFSAFKKYYRDGVERLCQRRANKIQECTFLDIHDAAQTKALNVSNISRRWQEARLYPFCSEVVLSKVQTQKCTLFLDNQAQLTQNPTNIIIKTFCTIRQIN